MGQVVSIGNQDFGSLREIEEKQYGSELLAKGIPKEKIRHYGFAFHGKEVLIG